jgi:hypothetical protein
VGTEEPALGNTFVVTSMPYDTMTVIISRIESLWITYLV